MLAKYIVLLMALFIGVLTNEIKASEPIPKSFLGEITLQNSPYTEPRSLFITTDDVENYYQKRLKALNANPAKLAAERQMALGQGFILGDSPMFNYPLPPNGNDSDRLKIESVCPVRYSDGLDATQLIDVRSLELIKKGKKSAPSGRKLLSTVLPTIAKKYNQAWSNYTKHWNQFMLPVCVQKSGIVDLSQNKPIKVTHKIIGDTLFILDEPPFVNPRKESMSVLEQKIYLERLRKAIALKNPAKEVMQAINSQNTYFLARASRGVADIRGRRFSLPPRAERADIYGVAVDYRESLLSKVCPNKLIEGNWNHHDITYDIYIKYATDWNNVMLPICRAKVTEKYPREDAYIKATIKLDQIRFDNIRYVLQSSEVANNEKIKVFHSMRGIKILRLRDQKELKNVKGASFYDLMEVIGQALKKPMHRFEVTYDVKYGYPLLINLQATPQSKVVRYKISNLELDKK